MLSVCLSPMVLTTSVRQVMTAATVFSPVVAKLTSVACEENDSSSQTVGLRQTCQGLKSASHQLCPGRPFWP